MVGVSIQAITRLKEKGSREVVIIGKIVAVKYAMIVITLLVTALKEGVSNSKDLHTTNKTVGIFTGVCFEYIRESQQGIDIVLRVRVVKVIIMQMRPNEAYIPCSPPRSSERRCDQDERNWRDKISLFGLPV